jgi:hypothetical protein
MKDIMKKAQEILRDRGYYTGAIDGDIGRLSTAATAKLVEFQRTNWDARRKCHGLVQAFLNAVSPSLGSPPLLVDGLWGPKSTRRWTAYLAKTGAPPAPTPVAAATGSAIMPKVTYDPHWNVAAFPTFQPTGIVLHRTAGYFDTGDYAVGKWGHYNGPKTKGQSLGFHFLVGKNPGQIIQFVPADKRVSHVKAWSAHYLGIEISGDVGLYGDGYLRGEALTDWQIEMTAKICKWAGKLHGIPMTEVAHQSQMHTVGVFHGLVGHRDLSRNDHADSPNKADWAKIMTEIGRL